MIQEDSLVMLRFLNQDRRLLGLTLALEPVVADLFASPSAPYLTCLERKMPPLHSLSTSSSFPPPSTFSYVCGSLCLSMRLLLLGVCGCWNLCPCPAGRRQGATQRRYPLFAEQKAQSLANIEPVHRFLPGEFRGMDGSGSGRDRSEEEHYQSLEDIIEGDKEHEHHRVPDGRMLEPLLQYLQLVLPALPSVLILILTVRRGGLTQPPSSQGHHFPSRFEQCHDEANSLMQP